MLSAILVLVLVGTTAVAASGGGDPAKLAARDDGSAAGTTEAPALDGHVAAVGGAQDGQADGEGRRDAATTTEPPEVVPTPTEIVTATVNLDQPVPAASADGSLLPRYRILTYYGHPHDSNMGILGEFGVEGDLDGLREALEARAAEYQKVDPSRPIMLAFEVIATVAQDSETADGSWLLDTDASTIEAYIDYAAEHDMLVFLDVQIGRRGVQAEVEGVRRWLERPNVHLALDPEFAMREGQIPGVHIGQIDASDVRFTQEYLANLSAELGIPPKVLIVHQFYYTMIENKDQLAPYPGVQLVIDMDGHGPPENKLATYGVVNTQQPIEFNGIKLFRNEDVPMLTPREILALDPEPDLIIQQ